MVLTNVKYTAIINPCFISDVFLRRTKTKQAAMNGIKLILEILAENRRVVRVGRMRGATSPGSFRAERVFVGADVVQR